MSNSELTSIEIDAEVARIRAVTQHGTIGLPKADVDWLCDRVEAFAEALNFYADPDSYFAILFMPDRPAGEFADDFSNADHLAEYGPYDRVMPGKRAREVLGLEAAAASGETP